jgi:Tol biopolymer transport system component
MRDALRPTPAKLIPALLVLAAAAGLPALLEAQSGPQVTANEQVWLVRADGQQLRRITDRNDFQGHPAWSPDGRRLAFTSSWRKRKAIVIYSFSTRRSRRITVSDRIGSPSGPEWSPRRDELAFSAFREKKSDLRRTVAIARSDGSNLRRLAEHEFGRVVDSGPVWSPDGRRIAYIRQRKTRESDYPGGPLQPIPTATGLDLVLATRGAHKRRIRIRGDEFDPRWSPDGRWILLVRDVGRGRYALARVSATGHRLRRVMSGLIGPNAAAWSPDGRSIALAGTTAVGDRHPHLYVVDARGGAVRQIAQAGEVALARPSWSPDGKLMAFADFDGRIRAVAPDGSGERVLVSLPNADFFELAWSPDGRRLAFEATRKVPET